jgi:hypothetical protein
MNTSTDNKSPKWLVNIQENSWNVELIISISFTFILLRLPQVIDDLAINYFMTYGFFTHFGILRFIINLALYVLPIGFIAHLIFRGIWIGLVGFSYVFPNGFSVDEIKFPSRYKRIIEQSNNPTVNIVNLEKTCSLIFTFTFLVFFLLLAVFNFFLTTGVLLEIVGKITESNLLFLTSRLMLMLIGVLYAFDFFTSGLLKKWKFTSSLFFPIYWIISIITLSKLYRTQYYTLITQYNKAKVSLVLFSVLAVYIVGTFISKNIKTDSRELYSNTFHREYLLRANWHYEDKIAEGRYIESAAIQTDIVKDGYIRLIVPHSRYNERYYLINSINEIAETIKQLESNGDVNETYQYVNSNYNKLYRIFIDDELLENVEWLPCFHPKLIAGGVVSYIDIAEMSKGQHFIRILFPNNDQLAKIHFWKE